MNEVSGEDEAKEVIKNSSLSFDKKGSEYYERHKVEDQSELDFVRHQTIDWWTGSHFDTYRSYRNLNNSDDTEEIREYLEACKILGFNRLAEAVVSNIFEGSEEIEPEDVIKERVCWECGRKLKSRRGRKSHKGKCH